MINDFTFTQEAISSRVEEIIRQHVGSDMVLSPETDLINDLGMDSLELVELGLKMGKEFGIKIPAAELRRCVTVEEVIQLVQQIKQDQ